MTAHTLTNDHHLVIQRFNQGIKLVSPDKVNPFKKQIELNDMLNMPFHVYFLNLESAVELANPVQLATLNILSISDMLGLTALDFAKPKAAKLAIHHDKIVLNSGKLLIKDESCPTTDGIKIPVLSFKYPWHNASNQCVGVFGFSIALDNKHGMSLADSMRLLMKTGLLQSESITDSLPGLYCGHIYFTEREKIILLQLIRGKTACAIGSVIGRSRRTVESHIENMKNKTNSSTKSELIEKIIDRLDW